MKFPIDNTYEIHEQQQQQQKQIPSRFLFIFIIASLFLIENEKLSWYMVYVFQLLTFGLN